MPTEQKGYRMSEQNCHLAEGFSTREKIFAQVTFNAFWITGFIAIWPETIYGALAYAALVLYGIFGLVVRYLLCPRCPHLYKYGDCLQVPPALTKWLVKRPTNAPMSTAQKVLMVALSVLILMFPQYWLWQKPIYFTVFWVFCGAWFAGQLLYFCRHCRVSSCPFNRANA